MRAAFALFLLLAAIPAVADACVPTTSSPEVDAAGLYYVDYHPCQPGCLDTVWIYEESNGRQGLQRADGWRDDTCDGLIEGDTLIF